MTTVSKFSRQNEAGLRSLNVVLSENLLLAGVLVLESRSPESFHSGESGTIVSLLITVGRIRNLVCRKVRSLFSLNRDQHLGKTCSVIIVQASYFLETVSLLLFTTELIYSNIYIEASKYTTTLGIKTSRYFFFF